MGIPLGSNFDFQAALPLDSRTTVADLTARDAILSGVRYQGMTVFVISDEKTYQLKAGITNGDWVEFGTGGGGGDFKADGSIPIAGSFTLDSDFIHDLAAPDKQWAGIHSHTYLTYDPGGAIEYGRMYYNGASKGYGIFSSGQHLHLEPGLNKDILLIPTGTGSTDAGGARIKNLATPTASTDAATKAYVDSTSAKFDASLINGTTIPIWSFTTPTKLTNPTTLPTGAARGSAISPNGRFLSVAHDITPFVTIYERNGNSFQKLANPATLPGGTGLNVAFSPDSRFMSVSHSSTPFVTIYEISGTTFTKLANPATLPGGGGNGTAFSSDGRFLSVSHSNTPFVTIYERNGTTFTKLANPGTLPGTLGNKTAFSNNGKFLAVTHNTTPFVTIYEISGTTFTKLADPAVLPAGTGVGVAFSPDSKFLSVGHDTTPFVTIYEISGTTFTKIANPDILPTGLGHGVTFSPDSKFLSVGHETTPFITNYSISGTTFTKLANPATLPPNRGGSTSFSSDSRFLSAPSIGTPFIQIYETVSAKPDPVNKTPNIVNWIGD